MIIIIIIILLNNYVCHYILKVYCNFHFTNCKFYSVTLNAGYITDTIQYLIDFTHRNFGK